MIFGFFAVALLVVLGACGVGVIAGDQQAAGLAIYAAGQRQTSAVPTGYGPGLAPGTVPPEYEALILASAGTCEAVTPPLQAALIDAESGWNPNAVSPVGAQGLTQFMPATWMGFGLDGDGDGVRDPFNPADAIPSSTGYLCHLAEQVSEVGGDPTENMLAAYNAGPGAVLDHGGIPPYPETQAYVPKILALARDKYATVGAPTPVTPGQCPPSGSRGAEDRLEAVALALMRCGLATFPPEVVYYAGGWGTRARETDHDDGLAVDFMITDYTTSQGNAAGWQVAQWATKQPGVTYVIFDQRMWGSWEPERGWEPMEDRGSDTENHLDHVHVSVSSGVIKPGL